MSLGNRRPRALSRGRGLAFADRSQEPEPASAPRSVEPRASAAASSDSAALRPRARCVVFGGGPYVLRLIALMARQSLPAVDWVLVATRPDPLSAVAHRARQDLRAAQPEWTVSDTLDADAACAGADAIVVLIRVGGLRAREWDESFPARHGLVGDEGVGIGGMANAWRTLPAIDDLARRIRAGAPRAFVFNLTAPLGITTRAFLDCGLATLGVCELPRTTRDALGPADPQADPLDYGGLNHLGWFWPRDTAGHALLEDAIGRGLVDRATCERFGAAPLSYYYDVYDPDAAARLGRSRPPGRARRLGALRDGILEALRDQPAAVGDRIGERPTPWFEHALVPALTAALRREPHETVGNIANASSWAGLGDRVVVEHRVRCHAGAIEALTPGTPPAPVVEFLARVGASEQFLYDAARGRDRDLLARAIAAQPLPIGAGQIAGILADVTVEPQVWGAP